MPHTPGPWHDIGKRNICQYIRLVGPDGGTPIIESDDPYCGIECPNIDDARLIAAAPDLLAALKRAARNLGENSCNHDTDDGDYTEGVADDCTVCIVHAAIAKVRMVP